MTNTIITMCPALYGDSFLIQFPNEKFNLLVDTGFISTYDQYLKPRLIELKSDNQAIDLLVISHIDADHISGAIKLLEDNLDSAKHNIIEIKNIWHNSYRHIQHKSLISKTPYKKNKVAVQRFGALGYPLQQEEKQNSISAKQGSSLATKIEQSGYNWNSQFNGNAVIIENQQLIQLTPNLKLILLSPNQQKLEKLRSYWFKELQKLGYIGQENENIFYDDAFEFAVSREKSNKVNKKISVKSLNIEALANSLFKEDDSITNGSSISFILEYLDHKFLFLGDSHPSLIEQNLRKIYSDKAVWFDAIKISHHGSQNNTSPSILEIIDSDYYFISTNSSKFSHPDYEALARIIYRPTQKIRQIIFNYEHEAYHYFNDQCIMKKYQYSVSVAKEMYKYMF